MKKWEHKIEKAKIIGMMQGMHDDAPKHMDNMSADGWELVTVNRFGNDAHSGVFFWKRRVT